MFKKENGSFFRILYYFNINTYKLYNINNFGLTLINMHMHIDLNRKNSKVKGLLLIPENKVILYFILNKTIKQ